MIIRMTGEEFERFEYERGTVEVGGVYTVVECCNENNPGAIWHQLIPGDNGGVGGNMNPQIKRYHGWRGTTNGTSRTACGVRAVLKIERYKNGNVKIALGEDLKADEE